jgi:hypothetical protein
MQYVTTNIPVSYDREWIAKTGNFITWVKDPVPFDIEGASEQYVAWQYCAENIHIALELINDYPKRYLEKKLPEAKAAIEARATKEFLKGFVVPNGTLAGQKLQCRDTEDRTNWLTSQVSYSAAIALGAGSMVKATFRTADNETFTVSYNEGAQVLLGMAAWGAAIMARAWALKDAAKAATTITELEAVLQALDTGWPSNATA